MGLLGWLVVGGLAGWIASMITGNNPQMGLVKNIVVGILGAFIGGFVVNALGGRGLTGFSLWSVVVSVIGAVILLTIVNLFRKRS